MTSNEPVADAAGSTWREQAVARSLDSARARAENRVQRFIDAALELIADSETGKDFTVQEVVERSGQSLRSFYQYFGGKQELLLALFEESVRSTAEDLRERVDRGGRSARAAAPLRGRVLPAVPAHPKRGKAKRGGPVALAEFAQQLMTAHPEEATRAYAPLVSLFEEVLDDAVSAGAIRGDLHQRRVAGVVLEAIMFNVFSDTIGGSPAERATATPPRSCGT